MPSNASGVGDTPAAPPVPPPSGGAARHAHDSSRDRDYHSRGHDRRYRSRSRSPDRRYRRRSPSPTRNYRSSGGRDRSPDRYGRGRSPPRYSRGDSGVSSEVAQLLKRIGGPAHATVPTAAPAPAPAPAPAAGVHAGMMAPGMVAPGMMQGMMPGMTGMMPGMAMAGMAAGAARNGVSAQADKAMRELYIGNLPVGTNVMQLREFALAALRSICGETLPPNEDPITQVRQQDPSQRFAFIEFSNAQFCTAAMALNGMMFLGQPLRVNRPKLYHQVAAAAGVGGLSAVPMHQLGANTAALTGLPAAGAGLAGVAGLANAGPAAASASTHPTILRASNLGEFSEADIGEVFGTMGKIEGITFVQAGLGEAEKVAEIEYATPEQATAALAMNGLQIGDRSVRVVRKPEAPAPGSNASALAELVLPKMSPTSCIVLHGLLQGSHCADASELAEIGDDVVDECTSFGHVQGVRYGVPPSVAASSLPAQKAIPVFVCFSNATAAAACAAAMRGRRFEGRAVASAYISTDEWDALADYSTGWTVPEQEEVQQTGAAEAEGAKQNGETVADTAAAAPVDMD